MNKWIGLWVITSLAASPAQGNGRDAAYSSSSDRQVAQNSVFAGASWRVGLDRRTSEARGPGRASLTVTGMTRTASADFKFGQGLELSGGQTGRPALFMAGHDLGQFKRNVKLNGTTTAIVVGVLLVGAVVAAVAIHEATKCEEDCAPAGGS